LQRVSELNLNDESHQSPETMLGTQNITCKILILGCSSACKYAAVSFPENQTKQNKKYQADADEGNMASLQGLYWAVDSNEL
jgi:hypothetical protein